MYGVYRSALPCGTRFLVSLAAPPAFCNPPSPTRCLLRLRRSPRLGRLSPRRNWASASPVVCRLYSSASSSITVCRDKEPGQHDAVRPWILKVGEEVKSTIEKKHLQIVLFEPKIAGNTGSIARTCAAASVGLHLIEPLGFQIDDAKLKRAGLDYWPFVFVKLHASWSEFMHYFQEQDGDKRLIAFTKRGTCLYTEKRYRPGDWLVFGAETTGLSAEALADCAEESKFGGGKVRIPMVDTYVRSLNLAVSAGIGLYEALRQLNVLPSLTDGSDEVEITLDELSSEAEGVTDGSMEQCMKDVGT